MKCGAMLSYPRLTKSGKEFNYVTMRAWLAPLLLACSCLAALAQLSCSPKTVRIASVCVREDTPFGFCDEQREAVLVRVKQENLRLSAANVPLTFVASHHVDDADLLPRTAFLLMQSPTPPDAIIGFKAAQGVA